MTRRVPSLWSFYEAFTGPRQQGDRPKMRLRSDARHFERSAGFWTVTRVDDIDKPDSAAQPHLIHHRPVRTALPTIGAVAGVLPSAERDSSLGLIAVAGHRLDLEAIPVRGAESLRPLSASLLKRFWSSLVNSDHAAS